MTYSIDGYEVYSSDTLNDQSFLSLWSSVHNDPSEIAYFNFLESVNATDISFRYFFIGKKRNEELLPCARIYVQQVHFDQKNLSLENRFLSVLAKTFLRFHPFKMLIFGNTFAVNFTPVNYIKGNIEIPELAKIICELSGKIKHDVLILKDIPDEFNPELEKKPDLEKYNTDLTMTLSIRNNWNSFEDYLSDLTKKYRKRAERILAQGAGLVTKGIGINDFPLYHNRINELLEQVASKQMVRIGIVNARYILRYLEAFPDRFKITGIFNGNDLIAFYTSIDRGSMLEIHYIGIDYKFNAEYAVYFNILFYALQQALAENKTALELGRTAREAKASLGATAEFFNDYIRLNNRLARFLSKKLTGIFQSEMGEKWMERKPLRTAMAGRANNQK
jgi:hypothetical protein